MTFYANIGYKFAIPGDVITDGSIILASALPMHQLERRKINKKYPHMKLRLFDPQLYLSDMDAYETRRHTANLASYPWFGVDGLSEYKSAQQTQSKWSEYSRKVIPSIWPGNSPANQKVIDEGVQECIDFQIRKGCWGIILPSPLTTDPSTDYTNELRWLDASLTYCKKNKIQAPLFATVAISDLCVRYADPKDNILLELITDSISAREVDGVYIVLEQGSEPADGRSCSNTRSLRSILDLVHIFSKEAELRVVVNFFGFFGLALLAAGAEIWASGWYKSVYRLRIADALAGGRAYPSYWNYPTVTDIHLGEDFDILIRKGLLPLIKDKTSASDGLLSAVSKGIPSDNVPAWNYRQSNVAMAREHFFRSAINASQSHSKLSWKKNVNKVEKWLENASMRALKIEGALGRSQRTITRHVAAWHRAFIDYRQDHRV